MFSWISNSESANFFNEYFFMIYFSTQQTGTKSLFQEISFLFQLFKQQRKIRGKNWWTKLVKPFDKFVMWFKKKHFEIRLTWDDRDDPTSTVRRQALLAISFALTFTIIPKEIRGVIFCLLAVLSYLCGEVSKRGPVERKGYCISVIAFLFLTHKY